eukprot:g39155.t1
MPTSDPKKLQKVVYTAQTITQVNLPSIDSIYMACYCGKTANIIKDPLHPGSDLLQAFPSDRSSNLSHKGKHALNIYPVKSSRTRIIYDRKFLMECRNSPVARTPPRDLPNIPGVTSLNATEKVKPATNHVNSHEEKAAGGHCKAGASVGFLISLTWFEKLYAFGKSRRK